MTTTDNWNPSDLFDKDQIAEITAKEAEDKIDRVWADRISTLPVGHGFRARREEGESVRQLKRRLNAAAGVSYRELEWFPEQKNVKPEDVTSFVVKVRSLNIKKQREDAEKKAAAEAAKSTNGQDASNPSQEAPQTPSPENNGAQDNSSENAPAGPRSARNR
jgi:hypothetical protein